MWAWLSTGFFEKRTVIAVAAEDVAVAGSSQSMV
jgi:hypothetical protein